MVARTEISGLHIYDRGPGLHCLLDEVAVAPGTAARCGPRQLSVALTKRCNLACHYCYSNNNGEEMPVPLFEEVCRAADAGQVLDVTLGGGEPSLHPRFAECVLAHLIRFAEAAGCHVKVTDSAARFVPGPFLVTSHPAEFLFAHVDQGGGVCRRNWEPPTARAATWEELLSALRSLHPLRGKHEDLA